VSRGVSGILDALPPRGMTAEAMCENVPAARNARVLQSSLALDSQGRRECRIQAAPMVRLQQKKAGGSHHRFSRNNRHSLRDGFTAYSALSPGCRTGVPGLIAPVTDEIIRRLDPSVGRSGPHAFAVRFRAARLAALKRPSHPRPNVRGDRASAPCGSGRGSYATESGFWKSEIFFEGGVEDGVCGSQVI
jgi:hypothetical protein